MATICPDCKGILPDINVSGVKAGSGRGHRSSCPRANPHPANYPQWHPLAIPAKDAAQLDRIERLLEEILAELRTPCQAEKNNA